MALSAACLVKKACGRHLGFVSGETEAQDVKQLAEVYP